MSKAETGKTRRRVAGSAESTADNTPSTASRQEKTPVTFLIPKALDRNVAVYCALEGVSKTEFITKTLTHTLREKGFDPEREPKISY
jgi:hypothetical protein